MGHKVHEVQVVSRSFIGDIRSGIQNFFGFNLTSYENMINKAVQNIDRKVRYDYDGQELKWYRYEISELTNGAMVIMLYGELNEDGE